MTMPTLNMTLSQTSVRKALRELKAYRRFVERKTVELAERLATLGAMTAGPLFGGAIYDGDNDVKLSVVRTEDGWRIEAKGHAVAFIEFGAGVYYNPVEPYPNRPPNVAHIGEYGEGNGKRQIWVYYDDGGEKHFTRGNPASMPMFRASEELRSRITEIAREVFASG